jgi:GMP synthase-like glutamine amidotransferase
MPTVVVLQREAQSPPALIGEYLVDARLALDLRRLDRGDPLPAAAELERAAALVTLGGRRRIGDDPGAPLLARERELLAAALAAGLPTLGVGLGAQQLCRAAGGDVVPRAALDLGWEPIEFSARDAFVAGVHPRPLVFSWRADTCRLPDAALPLADTDGDPQIFRVGAAAWGVQFHPELDRRLLRSWLREAAQVIERERADGGRALRAASRRELLRSAMVCGELMANFLTVARQHGQESVGSRKRAAPEGGLGL